MALTKQKVIENLVVLINESTSLIRQSIQSESIKWEGFQRWKSACQESLTLVFNSQSPTVVSFQNINYLPPQNVTSGSKYELVYFITAINSAKEILEGAIFIVDAWWQETSVEEPIKVVPFISYGGKRGKTIAYKIKTFLTALNIQPLIAEEIPNLGLTVEQKIQLLMSISNVGIVIMTAEDKTIKGEFRMRQNIVHEVTALRQLTNINKRVICFKEENVTLPSNLQDVAYNPLNNSNLESVYISIAKELKAFGFYL